MIEKDTVGKIIDYETGLMSDDEVIDFFQEMIDSGLVWQLQGSYQRLAIQLIEEGYCHNC